MQFICARACDANHFVPTGLAGGNGNGRARDLQKFCEKFDAGVVGLSIYRRSGERKPQRIANFAGHRILFRPRMDLTAKIMLPLDSFIGIKQFFSERKRSALCFYGFALAPKIAVPTRTQVDPSSIATSKSCDMPIESSFIETAGSLRAAIVSRNCRSLRK